MHTIEVFLRLFVKKGSNQLIHKKALQTMFTGLYILAESQVPEP